MPIPAVPNNFFVQQANGRVLVTWSIVSGATSYTVQRSTDGISYTTVASPVVAQYLDSTVTVNTQYYYKVASVNASGTSPYTSPQGAVPTKSGDLSLGQVRLMSQQRADRVNSNFVTTSEWNNFINQSYFELYDLLVTVYEDYFLAAPVDISTNGSTEFYPLPNGTLYNGAAPFYKLMGVDCSLGTTTNAWVTLRKFDFIERNRYVFPNITSTYLGVFNMQYRVMGNNLQIIPTPAGSQVLRMWYIPRMTELLADTDVLDGVSGWSQYVIVRAAKYALDKEESDTNTLTQELLFLKQRIEDSAMNRDAGQPDTISNTRSWSEMHGAYGGAGYDGGFGGY